MATSREVAEAYIEVHGDLSEFRKDLNDAGDSARKAGEANADDFADGWNKRIKAEVGDRWESMLDAMYRDTPLDWSKLIGKFDTTDLDRADVQIHDFMNRMQAAGKLNQKQYDEISRSVREVIKNKIQEQFVQADLNDLTRAHTDALADNIRFDKARSDQAIKTAEDIGAAYAKSAKATESFDKNRVAQLKEQVAQAVEQQKSLEKIEGHDRRRPGLLAQAVRSMVSFKKSTDDTEKSHGILHKAVEKISLSWARMDSTVRVVIGLILAAAGPLATLGSGIAGGATALAGSFAFALGSVIPLVAAMSGMGVAIALAVSGMDDLKAAFPGVQVAMTEIGKTWQGQARAFGLEWGRSLQTILENFNNLLGKYNIGEAMGKSMAQVTDAFNEFMTGDGGFNAFMQAMSTDLPEAVRGFGTGFAGVFGAVSSLLAGAAPVAAQLGRDFQNWGLQLGIAMEKARQSGKLTEIFERMRESLLIILDLAGAIGRALGVLFDTGQASGNRLLQSLTNVVNKFNDWARSAEGRDQLLQWFENAERIIKALEPVAVGLGKALAGLVTPNSIAQFENLMKVTGDLLPILGEILGVISDLGILNIVAELLKAVGAAVQPLLPPLGELARTIGPLVQEIFRELAPVITEVVKAAVPLVNAIVGLVKQLAPQLVPALVSLVSAISPLAIMVLELAAAVAEKLMPALGPALLAWINLTVGAFKILAEGVRIVVGVLTEVVTGLIDFFMNLGENITNFNATVNQGFAEFWAGIQGMFQGFVTGFQTAWDGFWGGLGANIAAIWEGLILAFQTGWTNLQLGFTNFVTGFQTGWDQFWNGLGEGLNLIWTGLLTFLTAKWNEITAGVDAVLIKPFQQFWDAFWGGLDPKLKAVIQGIILSIQKGWQDIQNGLNKFVTDFVNGWNGFWGDVAATNDRKWRETNDGFNRWATDINNTVRKFGSDFINGWNSMWTDVYNRATQRWSEIIGGFNRWAADINGTVNRFISDVIGGWNRFWGDIFSRASGGWNQIIGGFNNWANGINATVNGFINNVIGQWNGFWSHLGNVLSTSFNVMVSVAQQKINEIGAWFQRLPSIIGSALAFLANQLYNIGVNAIGSLARAIANGAGAIIGAITGAVGGAINAAKRMLGIASPSKVFTRFGEQTGEGFIIGMGKEEGDIRTASERMFDGVFESFDKSKALAAGQDAGRGLAEGLASSKARIAAAVAKIDPAISGAFTASVTSAGMRAGTTVSESVAATPATTQPQVIIGEGALQVITKATDPQLVGNIVLDGLSDIFTDRSKF